MINASMIYCGALFQLPLNPIRDVHCHIATTDDKLPQHNTLHTTTHLLNPPQKFSSTLDRDSIIVYKEFEDAFLKYLRFKFLMKLQNQLEFTI